MPVLLIRHDDGTLSHPLVLALGAEWRDRIEEAVARGANSARDRLLAEHALDVEWMVRELRGEALHGPLVEALVRARDRHALPLLAEVVEDTRVPEANRWAALYTAMRLAGGRLRVAPEDLRNRPRTVGRWIRDGAGGD